MRYVQVIKNDNSYSKVLSGWISAVRDCLDSKPRKEPGCGVRAKICSAEVYETADEKSRAKKPGECVLYRVLRKHVPD